MLLTRPLKQSLVIISPTEAFIIIFKLSILSGVILAFPYIIYQIWGFLAELFNKQQRKTIIKYILSSVFLFYGAISFAYFIVLPMALDFLINFGNLPLIPSITLSNYVDFAAYLLIAFGLVFQFPIVLLVLIRLNIVSLDSLKKKRRYILVIIFIIAAITTPQPDAISQLLLAIPMIILFEITLLIAGLKEKNKN